jgi:hypothetical protein
MSGYKVARLDEIDEMNDGRCPWRAVRHHLGITAFGINSWKARDAGSRILNEHSEEEEGSDEELYVVTRGRATFEVGDEKVDAPEGTFIFVAPNVRRTAFAEEAETTILAIGAPPGKAYEPSGWEIWAPAGRFLPGRGLRERDRGHHSHRGGQPGVSSTYVQPRLLRKPRRTPSGRRDRASARRD